LEILAWEIYSTSLLWILSSHFKGDPSREATRNKRETKKNSAKTMNINRGESATSRIASQQIMLLHLLRIDPAMLRAGHS
jgi:hypothetical protein